MGQASWNPGEDTRAADLYIVGAWGSRRVHAHSPEGEEQTAEQADGVRDWLALQAAEPREQEIRGQF